jgi:E3 ubiquitin-protein ligase RNF19A
MTCRVCKYEWCWLCGSTYSDIHFSPLNPLGCAGMQNLDRPALGKCRVYFGRVLMILGFLILLPIVIPFIMMCSGPVLVYNFLSKKMRSCNSVIYLRNFIVGLVSFLIGIVINPFIWVGATIYFTPTICSAITNWFERRRSMI